MTIDTATATIVIVDDDKLSTHNLALQFRFMGERPRSIASDGWHALLQNLKAAGEYGHLLALVVGQVRRTGTPELMAALRAYDAGLPLLVACDNGRGGTKGVSGENGQTGTGDDPHVLPLPQGQLTYESLRATLQRAATLSGRQPQAPASAIISPSGTALFRSLNGISPAIVELRERISQVAPRDVPVLVGGESGVGKEVVARNLHYHAGRGDMPFIAVNCAALAPENNGAELFGREELVDGQRRVRPGLLEQAAGGTLFFDQISELPLSLQAVLLRFLEDRQFQRVGGYQFLQVDVRVVAGTRQDLEELMEQNRFRKDLFYRLNLMPLHLPPLRERREDLPELIKELIISLESRGYPTVRLNASAVQSLQLHDWPGNVRELANLIERLGIIHPEGLIGVDDLPLQYRHVAPHGAAAPVQAIPMPMPVVAARPVEPVAGDNVVALKVPRRPRPLEALILPLDPDRLERHLANFEKQMVEMALSDAAGIRGFAASRLELEEAALGQLLERHGIQA